jgi:hypothetical protein
MTSSRLLTLTKLVEGLERYGEEYQVLDVFAWHVQELRDVFQHGRLGELQRLDPDQPTRAWFGFQRTGAEYQIKVHPSGIAQITRRSTGRLELSRDQLAQGGLEAEVIRCTEFPGMLLGFLIGAPLSNGPHAPRHVLTMRYNEEENRWRAYDGPQAVWIRNHALKIEPAFA